MTAASSGRPRGPYAKTAHRRAEIVERASEAFARKGFQGTSLREIAEATDVTLPGVMHHFPTKEALLIEVLRAKDKAYVDLYGGHADDPISVRLQQVVQGNADNPGLVRLYAKLTAEALTEGHPAHEYFRARYDVVRDLFAQALRQGQASGDVRNDVDASALAPLLTALMDGLQLQWLMDGTIIDMPAAFDVVLALLAPPPATAVPPARKPVAKGAAKTSSSKRRQAPAKSSPKSTTRPQER